MGPYVHSAVGRIGSGLLLDVLVWSESVKTDPRTTLGPTDLYRVTDISFSESRCSVK